MTYVSACPESLAIVSTQARKPPAIAMVPSTRLLAARRDRRSTGRPYPETSLFTLACAITCAITCWRRLDHYHRST